MMEEASEEATTVTQEEIMGAWTQEAMKGVRSDGFLMYLKV